LIPWLGQGHGLVPLALDLGHAETVSGTATTSDGDYDAKSGTITFAPGETVKYVTSEACR
jgi:hypothetical protein